MQINNKKAFSLIELIFVILITGILAVVAIPKLAGTAHEASKGKMNAFIGTMNRSVGPSLWSVAIVSTKGSVAGGSYDIEDYMDLPDGVTTIDLTACDANGTGVVGGVTTDVLKYAEVIYCKDGTSSRSPTFGFGAGSGTEDVNRSLQNN